MDAILAGSRVPKDISLFVSSTFRDMQDERDALRDMVLPRLREFVRQYGIAADLVDLRWGVDTSVVSEEEQDAKVLEVCLGEIDRCEPFFVLLLGDRYGYVPEGSSTSVTEQEIDHALADSRCAQRLVCCLRTIDNPSSLSPAQRKVFLDPTHAGQLSALRARLKADYPDAILEYSVHVERDGSYDLDAFCEQVVTALERRVREELGEPPVERLHPLEAERARQVAQAYRLSASFVGREEVVSSLASYCARDDAGLLLVQAEAGAGKTALVARLATQLAGTGTVVVAFCGLGPEVSDLPGLLRYLVWSLSSPDAVPEGLYDLTYAQLVSVLHAALEERLKEGPVTLLVDAVDQLADAAEGIFNWAGQNLPRGCHIVCTSLPGDYATALSHVRGSSWPLPSFGEKDARQLVDAVCTRNHKGALPDAVVDDLLAKAGETGGINPLYVSLVVRHLLMLGKEDYRAIDRTQREYGLSPIQAQIVVMRSIVMTLPADCEGMYEVLVCDAMEVTGLKVFPFFLLAIAASRWGLRVEDLSGSLGARFDPAVFAWFRQVLSEDFIQRGRMEWDFAHQSFRRMIWHRHRDELLRANRELVAPYLLSRARFTGDPLPGYRYLVYSADIRDAFVDGEVMHHLYLSDDAASAAGLLSQSGVVPLAKGSHSPYFSGTWCTPLVAAFLDGLADICALEVARPFEDTFVRRVAQALRGHDGQAWYWFALALDRMGLFSSPALYDWPWARKVLLYEDVLSDMGSQPSSGDLGTAAEALVHCEAAYALATTDPGLMQAFPDRVERGISHCEQARFLAGQYDESPLTATAGFSCHILPRISMSMGDLIAPERPEDAIEWSREYLAYTLQNSGKSDTQAHKIDVIAGYGMLLGSLIRAGRIGEADGLLGQTIEVLQNVDDAELSAQELASTQKAWMDASTICRLKRRYGQMAAFGTHAIHQLLRLCSLWPNYLMPGDVLARLANTLPAFGRSVRLDERARKEAGTLYLKYRCKNMSCSGLMQLFISAGLGEDVVTQAYQDERRRLAGGDEKILEQRDTLDMAYALYEEFHGTAATGDAVLERLTSSLSIRIDSPAGNIENYRAAMCEKLDKAEKVSSALTEARRAGLFDDPGSVGSLSGDELMEKLRLVRMLRESTEAVIGHYGEAEERLFGLQERFLTYARELMCRYPSGLSSKDAIEFARDCIMRASQMCWGAFEQSEFETCLNDRDVPVDNGGLIVALDLLFEGLKVVPLIVGNSERARTNMFLYGAIGDLAAGIPGVASMRTKYYALACAAYGEIKSPSQGDGEYVRHVKAEYLRLSGSGRTD